MAFLCVMTARVEMQSRLMPYMVGTLTMIAAPSLAHHPMGGGAPQSLLHEYLSGVGHPIIGLEHLAFIFLVGLGSGLLGGKKNSQSQPLLQPR